MQLKTQRLKRIADLVRQHRRGEPSFGEQSHLLHPRPLPLAGGRSPHLKRNDTGGAKDEGSRGRLHAHAPEELALGLPEPFPKNGSGQVDVDVDDEAVGRDTLGTPQNPQAVGIGVSSHLGLGDGLRQGAWGPAAGPDAHARSGFLLDPDAGGLDRWIPLKFKVQRRQNLDVACAVGVVHMGPQAFGEGRRALVHIAIVGREHDPECPGHGQGRRQQ